MSDCGEAKAPQEGETIKNSNKRTLDKDSINDKKVARSKLRKLEFEKTEDDVDTQNQSARLKKSAKPAARKLRFKKTEDGSGALSITCSICREPYLDPVVTNCIHYFCSHCALKHHETNINCFVCDQPTLGRFNTAVEMKKKIAEVRERAKAMVKEVSTMMEKAVVMMKNAKAISAESVGMVKEVETMVGIVEEHREISAADPSLWDWVIRLVEDAEVLAAKARDKAEKAADMVKEAKTTAEKAMAEMGKALMLMAIVKWNV